MTVLQSELDDWLKDPVTEAFKQAIQAELSETKKDLTKHIDSGLSKDDLYDSVLISKATQTTYSQLCDDDSDETITNMIDNHGLLTKEVEDDQS